MNPNLQTNAPGMLLALALGIIAWFLAPQVAFLNSIILGLVIGLIVGNIISIPEIFEPGIQRTSTIGLELSILFLSFSINYRNIGALGFGPFLIIAVIVFGTLV